MSDELITKGFNAGYLIEKHLPELAKQLANGLQDNPHPFAEGFTKGVEEMTKERIMSHPKFLDRMMDEFREPDHHKELPGKEEMDMDFDR